MSTFEIRRGAERARTRTDWLDSAHSFAFGSNYDPDNLGFGALQAFNSDVLQPGPGYPVHAHRDVEILTWVLAGSLTHRTEDGETTVVPAGDLHYVSAGSGIRHTEFSSDPDRPVHVVQMWLRPDSFGGSPRSARLAVGDRLAVGRWVLLAAGLAGPSEQLAGRSEQLAESFGTEVLRIRQRGAALSAARLPVGATVPLPQAPFVHAFVTRGAVTLDGPSGASPTAVASLAAGDALRVTGGGEPAGVTAVRPAELLVWQLSDDAALPPK